MSKFTPGDWHVSELDATGEKSEYYIFIEPGVAVIERSAGSQYDMADAHLLAASKLLLEALIQCRAVLLTAHQEVTDEGKPVVEQKIELASLAIAKAGGEA